MYIYDIKDFSLSSFAHCTRLSFHICFMTGYMFARVARWCIRSSLRTAEYGMQQMTE